ncbi:hypothetical protein OsI_36347 [Oryza sativa Indica Group]|uniref:GRF-type domain-containing protein n=1 Tax=Oryza sativa subsp. indica TaxID=39946 RepID=A2ZEX9_ORYSI|nr:hypothetical protein OsI_36347 [Oryza sativa Indica Group]
MATPSSSCSGGHRKKVQLLLIQCSLCKENTIVVRTSRTPTNLGRIFYTCPDHEKDGSGCNFWYWEEGYMKYLKRNGFIDGEEATEVKKAAELKNASKFDGDVVLRQDDELKKALTDVVSIGRELVVVMKLMLVVGSIGVALLVGIMMK